MRSRVSEFESFPQTLAEPTTPRSLYVRPAYDILYRRILCHDFDEGISP